MAKITVILTSYNKPKTVGLAIESVINQTFNDWQLYIADDNSSDEVKGIIRGFRDKRIIYYQSNVSEADRYELCRYARLINLATKATQSKYVTYISDDVVYYKNRLEAFYDYLEKSGNAICYGGQDIFDWNDGRKIGGNYLNKDTTEAAAKIDHSSVMHTRLGVEWGEDKKYWGNADACYFQELNNRGHTFYYANGIFDAQYRTRESLRSDKDAPDKMYGIDWSLEVDFRQGIK